MVRFATPHTVSRHLKRHRQVVHILVKHGFGQLVDQSRLRGGISRYFPKRQGHEVAPLTRSERVRLALEELGPTYVKLGQMLSTRPDLIPPEYIAELEKLQSSVPAFPDDEAKQIIESELGRPLRNTFPILAASRWRRPRSRRCTGLCCMTAGWWR